MWDLGCISEAEAVGHGRRDDVIPWDEPGSLDGAALALGPAHIAHWLLCFSTCSRFPTEGGLCSSELLTVQSAGDSPDFHCGWLATVRVRFKEGTTNQSWLCRREMMAKYSSAHCLDKQGCSGGCKRPADPDSACTTHCMATSPNEHFHGLIKSLQV